MGNSQERLNPGQSLYVFSMQRMEGSREHLSSRSTLFLLLPFFLTSRRQKRGGTGVGKKRGNSWQNQGKTKAKPRQSRGKTEW